MCFLTVDETQIQHYIPETKKQSWQQTFPSKSAAKKVKIVPSAGKVMAPSSSDSQSSSTTVESKKDRGAILQRFTDLIRYDIEGETASFAPEKSAFYHDNAPACVVEIQWIVLLLVVLLIVLPIRKPERMEVIAATDGYFAGFATSYFSNCLMQLEH